MAPTIVPIWDPCALAYGTIDSSSYVNIKAPRERHIEIMQAYTVLCKEF